MIDATQIAAAMQVPCLLSGDMIQQMQLWEELYLNRAGWIRNRIRSCHIPANIAQELKRLTLTEFSATVHDAAELEQAVSRVLPKLRRKMDFGLAIGGLLLKPYFTAQGVSVDIVPQNAYLPVNYTDDSCDAVVCPEEISIGRDYFTRLELHVYSRLRQTHTIQNRCFRSASPGTLGTECSLDAVPQWADVLPEKVYEHVQRPLFAIFRHRIPTTSTPLHRWAFRSLPMPWTLSGMRMSTGNESCGNWNRPNVPLMPPRICSGTRTASRYCPRAESGCSAAMRNGRAVLYQYLFSGSPGHCLFPCVQSDPAADRKCGGAFLRHTFRSIRCGENRRGSAKFQAAELFPCKRHSGKSAERTGADALWDAVLSGLLPQSEQPTGQGNL